MKTTIVSVSGCVHLGAMLAFVFVAVAPTVGRAAEAGVALSPEDRAVEFVQSLTSSRYAEAGRTFDTAFEEALPVPELKKSWQSIEAEAGLFREIVGVRGEPVGSLHTVFVTCRFERSQLDVKLVYDEAGDVVDFSIAPSRWEASYDPPAYVDARAFREIRVRFGVDRWRLPGTLTLPKSEGQVPAVVLVHDAGPHDQDASAGPNKPFRDLAWGLAGRGVAVLRYEKRSQAHPNASKALPGLTLATETVDDAAAAIDLLSENPRIDPQRIYVLGHGLGGMAAPRIAKARPGKVAGLILLAAPSRPLEDVIVDQVIGQLEDQGVPEDQRGQIIRTLRQQAERVKSRQLTPETSASELPLNTPASYWLDLRFYDPLASVGVYQGPILVLQGNADRMTSPEDFEGWKSALGDRQDAKFKRYEGLDHQFMAQPTDAKPSSRFRGRHVAEEVVADIAAWVRQ